VDASAHVQRVFRDGKDESARTAQGDDDVTYLVFSQESGGPPHDRLATNAGRFFASTLELLEQTDESMSLRLVGARPPLRAQFRLTWRATTRDDRMAARDAEARGRAAGMSALAEKCAQVWTIEAAGEEGASDAAFLTLAAICASVALGPVLPPDGSTLFGVRGAIERRDKALA
jgi:hypothetical protein